MEDREFWAVLGVTSLVAVVFFIATCMSGCASAPCLSTVTTSVEGGLGSSRSAGDWVGERYGSDDKARDVRAGVSLEWDATGAVCEDAP